MFRNCRCILLFVITSRVVAPLADSPLFFIRCGQADFVRIATFAVVYMWEIRGYIDRDSNKLVGVMWRVLAVIYLIYIDPQP